MSVEKTTTQPEQLHELLRQIPAFFRLAGILVLWKFGSLVLGIAFFIVSSGLWFGLNRFIFYWQPAENLLRWVLGISKEDIEIIYPPFNWVIAIVLFVRVAIALYLVYFGISYLFESGFCGQNLFCG